MNPESKAPFVRFFTAAAIISVACLPWLIQLTRFALKSDLYSHTILIPFVSFWLVWIRRSEAAKPCRPDLAGAGVISTLALAAVVFAHAATPPAGEKHHVLIWMTAAYALGLVAAAFATLGRSFIRTHAVAVCFLVFMVPMPLVVEAAIETALQRASAEAAYLFYTASGLPFLRDGQVFALPGITLEIAQECSGIHSSLVLFITSIVAGQILLPPGWKRWVLALFVLPLAVLRNGFRVWVLGELCVRVGPHMIHHWIHHHGGPIFFALSLIPFFLLLLGLRRFGSRVSHRASGVTPDTSEPVPPSR